MNIAAAESLNISLMFNDSLGNVWIGTRSDGVYRYTGEGVNPYTPNEGLLGDQVRAIAQDSRACCGQ